MGVKSGDKTKEGSKSSHVTEEGAKNLEGLSDFIKIILTTQAF